uniref:Endonuclease/exonuclease/phosphatase domain-containing protein n=1 Tax=Chenopodium quinoa TaxID=63459 RepID=A0A803MDT7_CHEQI
MDVDVLSFSQNHIDVLVDSLVDGGWRFSGIYGFPKEEHKHKTGLLLKKLADSYDKPWLCGGDFNLMLVSSEKQGGNFRVEEADIFRRAMDYCQFVDMGYLGHDITWTNNRGGAYKIHERLDRFVANQAWKELYPGYFITHLSKRRSDHLPILLCMKEAFATPKKKRLYRFEEMWLRNVKCAEIIANVWEGGGDLC